MLMYYHIEKRQHCIFLQMLSLGNKNIVRLLWDSKPLFNTNYKKCYIFSPKKGFLKWWK